ncbi:transglycosylase SLT domain-containing protein [Nocardia sp. BMG51109]|uniref:lytic transglycosylase domain-containing protein n=1 Tax=Nocardia sp. BMG51109 TaxID=1056816 RepID=UPI000467397C|nr:transglycosylase SLT domain-containing protein [Nocardia sp. BMG51109]
MTLTITDVEQWNPALLTTAGAGVGKLSGDLDQAVLAGVNSTHSLDWDGKAATAADDRMTAEKTRASAVSQAVLQLQTALTQQVENLQHAKDEVLKLRNLAENAPAPPGPFQVDATGTVTAETRKEWLRTNLPDGPDKDKMVLQQDVEAQQRTVELTRALAQATNVSEAAIQAVNAAKTQIDQAGTESSVPAGAPAPTTPAATAPPNGSPAPVSSSTTGGTGSSGSAWGNGSHGGGGHQSSLYSGGHSSGSYSGPTSGGPPSITPSGDVAQWVAQAKQVLLEMGYRPDQIDEQALAVIIEKESGGNPNAINLTDSNAAAGHPSKGLMQTIDSTFGSYAAPGHTDIWNPVDNIVAGARYSIERYGSVRHPGVESYMSGGQYHGY